MAKQSRSINRRDFLKSAATCSCIAVFGKYLGGCAFPASYVQAHQPIATKDAAPFVAELKPGVSTLDETVEKLKKRGVSNITKARGLDAKNDSITIDAVTGDNFYHVLLFRNKVFHRALNIGADEGTATRIYLHVAKAEGSNAIIVVSPDLQHEYASVVAVLLERDAPKRYFISTSYFPEWVNMRGMNDPLMNGTDLDGNGVTFVARGVDGLPWDKALVLRCDGKGQPQVTRIDMQKLLHCECIVDWYWKRK